jgi:hypothetical protein
LMEGWGLPRTTRTSWSGSIVFFATAPGSGAKREKRKSVSVMPWHDDGWTDVRMQRAQREGGDKQMDRLPGAGTGGGEAFAMELLIAAGWVGF